MWVRVPPGLLMDIEYWDCGDRRGLSGLVYTWMDLDTSPFEIKFVAPEQKYLDHLRTFTDRLHSYVRALRTIVKINGKYIFLDSVDSANISAESWKLPFDLIIKFQYQPGNASYEMTPTPVVPFTYTMGRYYDMNFVDKCWEKRQEVLLTRNFSSSMFWAGKIGTCPKPRGCVRRHIRKMKYASCERKPYEDYMLELATTQAGVAVAGTGDFTHRDIELMSVGNSFVSRHFKNTTRNPRVPNVHYYSIGDARTGINEIMEHFCEYFEPNGEYRDFTDEEWTRHCEIGYNARKWWEENGSPEGTFKLFCEILEENNIV